MKKLLIVMALAASAVAVSAQDLQSRRTSSDCLACPAQTVSQTVGAATAEKAVERDTKVEKENGVVDGVQLWEGGPYWAECNVGATKPEEFGYYFCWGGTVGYKREGSSWVSSAGDFVDNGHPFNKGSCLMYGKEKTELLSFGYVDETGNLMPAQDAATTHLGAPWRMPTEAEFSALVRNCDTEWTSRNGVYGRLVRGKGAYASKSIFLPAVGCVPGQGYGSGGCYWESSLDPRSSVARFLYFDSGDDFRSNCICERSRGQSIRPVREAKARAAEEGTNPVVVSSVANKPTTGKNVVAERLRTCEFLLNKKFKKNAKFYLCLFSASWCPPCRKEMRIAKTYAETLKDDPDIELIHFSRDRDEEKAMAWAKEHDVKFPVVKPNGGNPLDLHSRGIPHLFIVKADGTVLEEGHPMRIFNEEKFRRIKEGKQLSAVASTNGIEWVYEVVNGGVVLGCGAKKTAVPKTTTGELEIPETIDGMPVRSIGDRAFYQCRGLTSVIIPSSVTNIGSCAFYHCSGLKSVTIPEGVMSIGDNAFRWCSGLTSVTIPSSVTSIGYSAFHFCSGLTSVTIPESVASIGRFAFSGCKGLTSVTIPEGVTSIGMCAFSGCKGLTSVTIPEGVTSIGMCAFYECSWLTSVTIPSSVTSIGGDAFSGCSGLTLVTMCGERPDAHRSMISGSRGVFGASSELTAIHVPANAKSWAGMKEWQGIPLVFDAAVK